MDYFNRFLPVDITVDILARLPTESVLDSKLVCTRWRNLVSNHPSFSKIHLHHHLNHPSSAADPREYCKLGFLALSITEKSSTESFCYFEYNEGNHDDDDEESTKSIQSIKRIKFTSPFMMNSFVGSCNGLVCVINHPDLRFYIFNPITREYVLLPGFETDSGIGFGYDYGFGYVSSTNEYKVLVIYAEKTNVHVHIYTLGSRSGWRNLVQNFDDFQGGWNGAGTLVKEALYWMEWIYVKSVIKFDLAEEKFCEHLPLPPCPPNKVGYITDMGVLNGQLFIALYDGDDETRLYDIWLSEKKKPNHDKEEVEEHQSLCWRKEFRIDTRFLLAITKSGGVLTYDSKYLNIYHTKTSTSKSLVKFKNWIKHVIPHENSLVSLKELGEEDTKVMEAVEETENRDQLQEDTDREYIHL